MEPLPRLVNWVLLAILVALACVLMCVITTMAAGPALGIDAGTKSSLVKHVFDLLEIGRAHV